jgi:hypothetical protein
MQPRGSLHDIALGRRQNWHCKAQARDSTRVVSYKLQASNMSVRRVYIAIVYLEVWVCWQVLARSSVP